MGFSPFRGVGIGVTAYTLPDYALELKYRLFGGPGRPCLAAGACDVGIDRYVSPVGSGLDAAWPGWEYNEYLPRYNRQTENLSAFVVTSIPVAKLARLHFGLGRGRFVAYDARSKYFNIDVFFDEYHQWAFGLFGGLEVYILPNVAPVAEASGRDWNGGVRARFGPFSAAVAWKRRRAWSSPRATSGSGASLSALATSLTVTAAAAALGAKDGWQSAAGFEERQSGRKTASRVAAPGPSSIPRPAFAILDLRPTICRVTPGWRNWQTPGT